MRIICSFISQGLPSSKRTFELIAELKKRTFDDFEKFCKALEKTEQGHIVKDYLTHVAPPTVFVVENHFKKIDLNDPQYKVLSEEKKGCLRQHLNELCDKIVSDKLFFIELEKGDSFTFIMLSRLEVSITNVGVCIILIISLLNPCFRFYPLQTLELLEHNFSPTFVESKYQVIVINSVCS